MLVFLGRELFLGSIDSTSYKTSAKYMASIVDRFIELVGPHNFIVQLCTYNAMQMLNASKIINKNYTHTYVQWCATYAMDLLLKDWAKTSWLKEFLDKARKLVKFIQIRQMPLVVLKNTRHIEHANARSNKTCISFHYD